jgi:predicted GIY-YIG superfamily endonuclease
MYYIYLLKSISHPNQTYVGYTTNLKMRMRTHNSGHSPHTEKYLPWELIVFLGFKSRTKAMEFEQYLKSHSGRAFAEKRFW